MPACGSVRSPRQGNGRPRGRPGELNTSFVITIVAGLSPMADVPMVEATHPVAAGEPVVTAVPEMAASHPSLADDTRVVDGGTQAADGHRIRSRQSTHRSSERSPQRRETDRAYAFSPPERTSRLPPKSLGDILNSRVIPNGCCPAHLLTIQSTAMIAPESTTVIANIGLSDFVATLRNVHPSWENT